MPKPNTPGKSYMIARSMIRKYFLKEGLQTSAKVFTIIDSKLLTILNQAIESAKQQKRITVLARDIQEPFIKLPRSKPKPKKPQEQPNIITGLGLIKDTDNTQTFSTQIKTLR